MIDIPNKLQTILYSWWLWVLGWLANMLYKQSKWEKFKASNWVASITLSFLVAWLIWEFIPQDYWLRDWLLWISWATSYTIMSFIQVNWHKLIFKSTSLWKIQEFDKAQEWNKEDIV